MSFMVLLTSLNSKADQKGEYIVKFWGHVPPVSLLPFGPGIQAAWKRLLGICVPQRLPNERKPPHMAVLACWGLSDGSVTGCPCFTCEKPQLF